MSGREIIADPLNKKKKIELRQGGTHRQIVSRGCDPLQRGTFLRRAGEWPILGTSPASAPSEDDEKVGGRFSGGSIPGGYGKSPFSLDCTYHGCPYFPGRIVHRGFPDPPRLAEQATDEDGILRAYRTVRDQIRAFILTLPAALESGNPEES